MMRILRLILLPLFLAATMQPAHAAALNLNQINAYLNNLQAAKGRFTQINDDGTIATGTIYIRRPGRIRFEYDPPDRSLVIGFDPREPAFFWDAGQGGYGFQTAPAASQLAADIVSGRTPELDAGIVAALSPARFG